MYYWEPDKNGILRPADPDPDLLQIRPDPTTPTQTIPVLTAQEGTRYLGIYVTRNGHTKPMEDHVWKKAVVYTQAMQCTHMSQ